MENLVRAIEKLKNETQCDIVKVYYEDDKVYCVKFIKDGEVVRKIKKGKQKYVDTKQIKLTYHDDLNGYYVHKTFKTQAELEKYVNDNSITLYTIDGELQVRL